MKVWSLFFLVFLLLSPTLGEDTVADDIGAHQLKRLVELLTSKECEDLLSVLSRPEENIFQRVERLSPETNQLEPRASKPRAKREASTAAGDEARCRAGLTDWMLRHGEQTYYDRLARALQHIGRTDVAVEVGKNINQDKVLKIKRYVEDYHEYVKSLNIPLEQPASDDRQHDAHTVRKRRVRHLTSRDLDLVVERSPVPVYQKGISVVALPLLWGILLGFGGTLIFGTSIVLAVVHIWHGNQQIRQPRDLQDVFCRTCRTCRSLQVVGCDVSSLEGLME
uniref:transmembrane and death domain protein 1-like n=1 Tax=Gasterosteus aculeatus aculeatus TaxID=481459 RepID=UPI001A98AB27|nr:transmembrane and death domain protein 1-like [Gasterosteus aculeatus aculeatus]XP_040048424.1 transmembrane and death domain protein 1-like [Gasterosteus aculeatus aculeatus]